jgi:hypothetical protein
MLEAGPVECTDCGNPYVEGGQGPEDVDECVVCDGHVEDVDVGDILGV